jgi:toxin HigB-1
MWRGTFSRALPCELEALKGDRAGQHSIRINKQWRICFVWTTGGPDRVEIVDYH